MPFALNTQSLQNIHEASPHYQTVGTMNREQEEYVMAYELDSISLRDVAAMRYVRHQEWLDQVVGNNTSTSKLIQLDPKIFPETTDQSKWNFSDVNSLEKKLAEINGEISELNKSVDDKAVVEGAGSVAKVSKEDIEQLRESFGNPESNADDIISNFESKFGVSLIEKQRFRKVDIKLELPQYASAPEKTEIDVDGGLAGNELGNFGGIPGLEDLEEDSVMANM